MRKHNANAVNKYDIGMLVYLRLVTVKDKLHKLKYRYQGPYRIMDLVNNSVTLKYIKTGKNTQSLAEECEIVLSWVHDSAG